MCVYKSVCEYMCVYVSKIVVFSLGGGRTTGHGQLLKKRKDDIHFVIDVIAQVDYILCAFDC